MATKVFMEALSPTMEEGKVVSWEKREGDQVKAGDILAEVETDKAVMELQARGDGVLRKVLAAEGATVEVGKLVAIIAAPDEDIDDLLAESGDGKRETIAAIPKEQSAERARETEVVATTPSGPKGPTVERLPPAAALPSPEAAREGRIKVSPLARRIATERGIDLRIIRGSGPAGRIVMRDVEATEVAPVPIAPAAVFPEEGYQDVELSQMRKTIARRLAESLSPIPHFFLTAEIDMERTAEARTALNALGDEPRISFNDIIMKVVAAALRQHRECNAWWQGDRIRYFNEVHLGMAVAVEDGLITPVIRQAHRKSLREIATEARALAERARTRRLQPEEYTGATFSVSNLGMLEIDQFTAVINPPEAGILAIGSVTAKPVVIDGELVVRKRMRVTMSCDHRVIDGATGARFLQSVRRMLENPLAIVW
jgi:pyruvate dehydrogenase E2 component (dihydrolipoamide acetyltransferase)